MDMILTFDVGTTAIKTCLFGRDLTPVAARTDEYDLCTENGCIELEPQTYWNTMCRAVEELGKKVSLDRVRAVCMTTQGETMIPVDAHGEPLHRAVVWLDDRAGAQAEQIAQTVTAKELYHATGITDMNGFVPIAKLLWFRQERPEIYRAAHKFLLLEDYLLHRFTGRFATEKSLLTSTGWYDIRNDRYWSELLKKLDLDVGKLPELLDCGALAGQIAPEAASRLGLRGDVRIFVGAMDQIAAAIGGGGLQDGVVTATVGTAMVLTCAIPSMDTCAEDDLIVYRGVDAGQYVLLPLCNTAGAVFKWYKDQCSALEAVRAKEEGTDVYDVLCRQAQQVAPGAEGVTLLPYFAGSMQPNLLPEAKGVFYGLSLNADHKVMTRAVLESIGYMLRENLEMLERSGRRPTKVHFFGGGSKNPIWNQIIADITGVELVLLEQSECGSLGAAMLAAVSMGWYADLACAQQRNTVRQTVVPDPKLKPAYDKAYQQYQTLLSSMIPLFEQTKGE